MVVLGLLCAAWARPSAGQGLVAGPGDVPVQITADGVEFDQDLNVFTARGNVRIEQGTTIMNADWVALNNITRNGLASGNVVVHDEGDVLYADFLQFNLSTSQGVVYDGELKASTGFRLMGTEVRKTGQKTYEFEDPIFTTCNCPDEGRDPWSVKSKSATLDVGGYAITKNTTVRILGFPILWTPGTILPVKSERQSGFLFPPFSNTSRRGFEAGLPLFWAISPQLGLTMTPFYSQDRGFYFTEDFEYVIGPEGRKDYGTLAGTVVPDDQQVNPDTASTPFDPLRWGVRLRHQQFEGLPLGLQAKANVNLISDNVFTRDYDLLSEFRRDRFLESIVSLTRNYGEFSPFGSYAAIRWADDLQAPDKQDRDPFLLQRLPEAGVSQAASFLPTSLPFANRLLTSFDVRYTNFYPLNDPLDERPGSTRVNDIFLDTGIDALPDGMERNSNGDIVTLNGEIVSPDGTVVTAQELLAAQLAADPMADPEQILMALAPQFDPDQSRDDYPLPGGENDGIFEEGEPLADRGHRLVVNPRVAMPFHLGRHLEVYPELGYHGTFYQTRLGGFNDRQIITGRLDLRTRLRKVVDVPWLGGVDHVVEPRFTYYGIVDFTGESRNPLFVPQPRVPQERVRQLSLENVLRDPADRIPAANGAVVGVSNRFYTIEPTPEQAALEAQATDPNAPARVPDEWVPSRLFADVDTSMEYRTSEQEFRWFVVDGSVYPTDATRLRLSFGWDLDAFELAETKIEASWGSYVGHSFRFQYRYLRQIPAFFEDFRRRTDEVGDELSGFDGGFTEINQIGMFARVALTPSWALTASFRYSFDQGIILTNTYGVEYVSKCRCWAVQLLVLNDRDQGIDWRIKYSILGLGDDRTSSGAGVTPTAF